MRRAIAVLALVAGLFLSLASVRQPQPDSQTPSTGSGPNCKKGCPCGDACISCEKRCTK